MWGQDESANDLDKPDEYNSPTKDERILLWGDEVDAEEDRDEYGAALGDMGNEKERRGRPQKRQQKSGRSEHTVDTLPSLTDSSAVDGEELTRGSWSATDPPSNGSTPGGEPDARSPASEPSRPPAPKPNLKPCDKVLAGFLELEGRAEDHRK